MFHGGTAWTPGGVVQPRQGPRQNTSDCSLLTGEPEQRLPEMGARGGAVTGVTVPGQPQSSRVHAAPVLKA